MNFSNYLKDLSIELNFKANNKDEVLKEIARLANKNPILKKVKEKNNLQSIEG